MANNNIIFNAALAGAASAITGSRWIRSSVQADYATITTVIVAFANAVDAAIPAIGGGATSADGRLMESLCNSFWEDRMPNSQLQASYSDAAAAIAALFNQVRGNLLAEGGGGGGGGFPTDDGTVAAPAWTWTNDLALGARRDPVSGMMGWCRDNFEVLTFGNTIVDNLEPVPVKVRTAFIANVPEVGNPLDATESTVFYYKPSYAVDPALAFIYAEIDDDQVDTYGAAIKIVHKGHGDSIYIAQFSDGVGLECATFSDGSRGIISTYQEPLVDKSNSVLIQGLWEAEFVPNFGMIFADGSYGNAFVARKMATALDGVAQFRLIESNALSNRERWVVYGDGSMRLQSLAATAIQPDIGSPEFQLYGAHWDGAQSVPKGILIKDVPTGPGPTQHETRFYSTAGVIMAILRESGGLGQFDLQTGSLVNVSSVQSSANGDYYARGALAVQLEPNGAAAGDTALFVAVYDGAAWGAPERVKVGAAGTGPGGVGRALYLA